jgi:acetylornithine/N-succinyldiaminopimelate aminotransferase
MDHCFLTTTGAMANENAFKVIFQHRHPAHRILAFERCFMGRTLIMSQVTDRPHYREGLPLNLFVDYVPFYDPVDPAGSTERAVAVLRTHLNRYPKEHAMMCLELIQGDGGFHCGTREFFLAIIKELKEHQVAVFIDEVQTFGRTSELFAFQTFGLEELVDVVTIGKMSQVCATLFSKQFKPRPGLLSQTFTGSTSAIKAGKAIIAAMLSEKFFGPDGKIEQYSHYMMQKLEALAQRYPTLIEGPFGLGAMIAFTPFKGDAQKVAKFLHDLFEAGVIAFSTGSHPTRVRFLAPVGAITFAQIDQVIEIVESVIRRQG